ncbi:hypothetical protein C8Q78DRAFT_1080643 [Trametes maxima]|nr:hypothetical protein C8Q78DRAFT_1080643 [Trametes maxima]
MPEPGIPASLPFNPSGIAIIVDRLRHLDPVFTRDDDRHLTAMAIVYFVQGTHEDGQHGAGGPSPHPSYWAFQDVGRRLGESEPGYDGLKEAFTNLALDILTVLDRITFGSSVVQPDTDRISSSSILLARGLQEHSFIRPTPLFPQTVRSNARELHGVSPKAIGSKPMGQHEVFGVFTARAFDAYGISDTKHEALKKDGGLVV